MTFIDGDFWRICDRCGLKIRQTKTMFQISSDGMNTGLIVCNDCIDAPNATSRERISQYKERTVPNPRPRKEYIFLDVGEIQGEDIP